LDGEEGVLVAAGAEAVGTLLDVRVDGDVAGESICWREWGGRYGMLVIILEISLAGSLRVMGG
jgi:hypothetical protein